jgi:hypothetical protein
MDCARVRELLEEYTLGALEPSEQAEVERHLAGCPECREAARELEAIAHRLPGALAAASALSPPSGLRDEVLAAVAAEAGAPPRPRQPAWLSRRSVAAALVAALLALGLGWVAGFQIAAARESDRRAALARELGQQDIVLEVVDSRHTEKAFLRTRHERGRFARSYGKLYTRSDMPHVVAFAARLPRAPEGSGYHLWLTRGGRTLLAGVLTVREGFGLVVLSTDQPGPRYDAALLTLQRRGGAAPTGTRVLSWRA